MVMLTAGKAQENLQRMIMLTARKEQENLPDNVKMLKDGKENIEI